MLLNPAIILLLIMKIEISHGAGGKKMDALIKNYVIKYFGKGKAEVGLGTLDDAAVIDGIVFTTDSHTVKPLFFPGGDIGSLSVSGTVNDIAVVGARPLAISSALIIEEGFDMDDFERILESMKRTADIAGVEIVTGDTKVVEKNSLEGMVINTSGIGIKGEELEHNFEIVNEYRKMDTPWLLDSNLREGDKIILSGYIGDHGIAILSSREGYDFHVDIKSDVAPVNKLVERALKVGGVVAAKDPTRGGISNALNEWAEKSKVDILVDESSIPVREGVRAACEMLGIDVYSVGNEGKVLFGVIGEKAEEILKEIRKDPLGKDAQIIGEVVGEYGKRVILRTEVGGRRILSKPVGDPVPRIC